MDTPRRTDYLTYQEVMKVTGLPRRTMLDRIAREGMAVFIDGRDKRRRALDVRDVERLTRIEPVKRIEPTGREYDGSAA
jgi:hypothetical protein